MKHFKWTIEGTKHMRTQLRLDHGLDPDVAAYWAWYARRWPADAAELTEEIAALRLARQHGAGHNGWGGQCYLAPTAVRRMPLCVPSPNNHIWVVQILLRPPLPDAEYDAVAELHVNTETEHVDLLAYV